MRAKLFHRAIEPARVGRQRDTQKPGRFLTRVTREPGPQSLASIGIECVDRGADGALKFRGFLFRCHPVEGFVALLLSPGSAQHPLFSRAVLVIPPPGLAAETVNP